LFPDSDYFRTGWQGQRRLLVRGRGTAPTLAGRQGESSRCSKQAAVVGSVVFGSSIRARTVHHLHSRPPMERRLALGLGHNGGGFFSVCVLFSQRGIFSDPINGCASSGGRKSGGLAQDQGDAPAGGWCASDPRRTVEVAEGKVLVPHLSASTIQIGGCGGGCAISNACCHENCARIPRRTRHAWARHAQKSQACRRKRDPLVDP